MISDSLASCWSLTGDLEVGGEYEELQRIEGDGFTELPRIE